MSTKISIDALLDAMPEPRRSKLRRQIFALIHDQQARERADWSKIAKLKDARGKRRNGVRQLIS